MPQRPAYYKEIDDRFTGLELKQKEFGKSLDNVQINQAEQLYRINEIHILLAGTEYDKPNNGGMCGDFRRTKEKVRRNTNWRIRITAAGSAVAGIVGIILMKFAFIIQALKDLINAN